MLCRSLSGNKGMFFSLISLLILVLLATQFPFPQTKESDVVNERFKQVAGVVQALQQDIVPMLVKQDVFIALDSIARYINDTVTDEAGSVLGEEGPLPENTKEYYLGANGFIKDFPTVDFMVFHAVSGSGMLPPALVNYASSGNFSRQQLELAALLRNLSFIQNLSIALLPETLHVWQGVGSGYRAVHVDAKVSMFLDAGFANWSLDSVDVHFNMSIDGLSDPALMVKVSRSREANGADRRSPMDAAIHLGRPGRVVLTDPATVAAFKSSVENRTYFFEANAPSYMHRLLGDSVASPCCGMESIVAIGVTVPADVQLRRKNMVDWCYFDVSTRCEALMPSWQEQSLYSLDGLFEWDITKSSPGEQYYAFNLDKRTLAKHGLVDAYQIAANECSCPCGTPVPPGESREWAGPGCVGSPADNSCEYLCP